MKRIAIFFMTLCLLASLCACSVSAQQSINGTKGTNSAELLTREQAIALALEHAKLTQDQVFDLEAELDKERGNLVWEVDFDTPDFEYSYDIHAETGEVTKVEKERD